MNIVFVFKSNPQGTCYSAIARDARLLYGAQLGVGEGLTGSAYALPMTDQNGRRLSLVKIKDAVNRFMDVALAHPEWKFKVTVLPDAADDPRYARLIDMFRGAPANCGFDPKWRRYGLRTWSELGI